MLPKLGYTVISKHNTKINQCERDNNIRPFLMYVTNGVHMSRINKQLNDTQTQCCNTRVGVREDNYRLGSRMQGQGSPLF